MDEKSLHEVFKYHSYVITFEDGTIKGGFGSSIIEFAQINNYKSRIEIVGVPHKFISHGDISNIYDSINLSYEKIQSKLENSLRFFK